MKPLWLERLIHRFVVPTRKFIDRKFGEQDRNLQENTGHMQEVFEEYSDQNKKLFLQLLSENETRWMVFHTECAKQADMESLQKNVNVQFQKLQAIEVSTKNQQKDITYIKQFMDILSQMYALQKEMENLIKNFQIQAEERQKIWENSVHELKLQTSEKGKELESVLVNIKNLIEKKGVRIEELINNVQKQTEEESKKQKDQLEKQQGKFIENISKLEKRTMSITNEIKKVSTHYYYSNEYERGVLKSFYELYDNEELFTKAFTNLIDGMEQSSVDRITEIISRQKQIRGTNGQILDLYTQNEQNKINEMKKYMQSHTLEINENLYCYKHFFLPIKHIEASVFYFEHGINELIYPERIKKKDIVDVGGFIGDSVLILEKLQPKMIYTFEASSDNFDLLQQTLVLNKIENCVAENKALGNKIEKVTLELKGAQSNLNTIDYINCEGEETVEVETLDNYVSLHCLEIGLIKVDIEGAEQMFLQGAKNTICSQKPTLLLSIYHNADDFFGIKPLIESWNLGYQFRIHKPLDFSISREVLLICEVE